MDAFLTALPLALDPMTVALTVLGTMIGIVFGSIPGLTFSMALALVLPMTFAMPTVPSTAMLLGTFVGGMTGGSVSAMLMGVARPPSAAATVLDGYPMTRQGKAGLALGTAVLVSTFGGILSLLIMIVSVDFIAGIALQFGPVEIFALVLFGLSTICGLSEKSLVRGLIAGVLGLMVMTVGMDSLQGVPRMTFGSMQLLQGVDLLAAMIGLFAVPQVMTALLDYRLNREIRLKADAVKAELPTFADIRQRAGLMLRSGLIGTGIGAIPGTGGPIAAFLAYHHAKRSSRNPEAFGKGELSGVVAPETANNAVTGGAMIPLLSLGIPGDPATAIILGGLMLHGMIPGPMLFIEHKVEVYTLYISIVVAYISIVAIQFFGIRAFVRVLRVPPHILAVAILVLCVFGTFAIRNSFFDVYLMIGIGLVGYVLTRVRIPLTPIILGLVLGQTLEREFRTAMIMSEGNLDIFYTSPVGLFFFALVLLVILQHAIGAFRDRRLRRSQTGSLGKKHA